jgi:phage host-nuclease inhibitor protein Gam
MKNRIKLTAPALKSRTYVELTLSDICLITLNRNKAVTAMDAEISAVRSKYETAITECNKALEEKTDLIRTWAEAHPEEFNGLKSIDSVHAVFGWRTGQPQLKTRKGWTWDRVLEVLKLPRFAAYPYVRTKEEVNKQAILADRETLPADDLHAMGVHVIQDEAFFIEPKLTDLDNRQQVNA